MVKLIRSKYLAGTFFKALIILLVFSCSKSWGQTSNLFISEYIEGSSNNKYIEVYNGTGASVNLAGYVIRVYANGSASATSSFTLSGTLATCSVCVIENPGEALGVAANLSSGSLSFNGDDAVTLETTSGTILDVVGNIGCDPGTNWNSGGNTTLDKTLVRNASVCVGVTDDGTSCPFPTLATEWTQFNVDVVSNLGTHTITCASCSSVSCTPPTTTVTPTTQTVCANTTATVSVSSSATIPTYQWQMSANGTTGWANVANGTPTGVTYGGATSASLTATGTSTAQYFYQCLVTENGTCTATTNTVSITINAPPSITSQPISVTTTSTTSGSFTVGASGGALTYQWKEDSGSGFATITNGGSNPTYAGATSSVLTISNPPLSMSGYSYHCVVSNACGTATTNGTSTLTVNASLTCPYFVAAVVNACTGSCGGEGNNEFVVLNSGDYSIPVNGTDLNLVYNNGSDQFFTQSYAAQPAVITNLNSLAGCGTLFVDVSAGSIPANSTCFVMNQGSCFDSGSFSAYCGLGTIYVAFSSDATWSAAGFFGNNNSSRFFRTNFTTVDAGCAAVTYSYNNSNEFGFGTDGSSVMFNGTTPSYVVGNGDCVPPAAILPIELVDFYATQNGDKNELIWKVASEEGIRNYIIEKSEDGINWYHLSLVTPKGTAESNLSYSTEDLTPYDGITYYRLSTLESDWSVKRYQIISLDRNDKSWKPVLYQEQEYLFIEFKNSVPKNSVVNLYDLSGQVLIEQSIADQQTKISTQNLAFGIYFVRITTPYKSENFKIIIQK